MANKKISKSDLFEAGLLVDIITQAKELEKILKANIATFGEYIKKNPFKQVDDVKAFKQAVDGVNTSSKALADTQAKSAQATEELNKALADEVAQSKDIKKLLDQVNGSLNENIKLQTRRSLEIKKLGEQQARLNKQLKSGLITQGQYVQSTAALNKQTTQLKTANSQLLFTIKAQVKEGQAATLSFDQQAQRLGQLRSAYRKLNEEQRKNSKVGGVLLKSIKTLDAQVKKNDASIGNFQRNVGNYTSGIGKAAKETGVFQAVLDKVGISQGQLNVLQQGFTKGVGKSTGKLKLFRLALASTGIGLLVIALGSIVTSLTSSEEGMNKVNKGLKAMGIVVGNVSDIFAEFGDQLLSFFSGDGFDSTKLKKLVEDFGEETKREIDRQNELSDIRAENLVLQRELIVATAKGEKEIAELRFKAKQKEEFTPQERLAFTQKAIDIELSLLDKSLKLAERKNILAQEELGFNRTGTEQLNAAAEAEAELFRVQTTRFNRLRELQSELNRVRKDGIIEIEDEIGEEDDEFDAVLDMQFKAETERLKIKREAREKDDDETEKSLAKQVAVQEKLSDDELKIYNDKLKKKKEADKKAQVDQINQAQQLAASIGDSLDQVSEKQIQKIEEEQERTEKNLDRQERRAEQGLENNLAFEQKKAAELEKQKEDEAKKAETRAKVLAYLNLFGEFAKEDANSAAFKAAAQIAIAETVSGLFYEGTEKVEDDIAGKPTFAGRDGYVVRVDGSERIMTGQQNARLGNISNEDLVELATNNGQQGYAIGMNTSKIEAKLDIVAQAVRESGTHIEWDSHDNRIETKIENAVKKRTHYKTRRI